MLHDKRLLGHKAQQGVPKSSEKAHVKEALAAAGKALTCATRLKQSVNNTNTNTRSDIHTASHMWRDSETILLKDGKGSAIPQVCFKETAEFTLSCRGGKGRRSSQVACN